MHVTSDKNIDNQKLVSLLKAKDQKGFELLYERYAPTLYGVILKIVTKEENANDILQEVFLKIWRNIDSYSVQKANLYTWMLTIARNSAIDHTRKKEFNRNVDIQKIKLGSLGTETQRTDKIGVKEKVQKLDPELREIIDIIYFGGYTHSEASEALSIPLGSVKTRVRTALRELKKLIV